MQNDPVPSHEPSGPQMADRPHTGRARNEAARRAILAAAADLLGQCDLAALSVDKIAATAGVGRQTIYRWWPSKGAVLLEAMIERASSEVPPIDSGTLIGDLEGFLTATFRAASEASTARLLRTVMAESLRDPHAGEVLQEFTARRREAMREILSRAEARSELAKGADWDLVVDQAFGLLWYRTLIGHEPLARKTALGLARALVTQVEGGWSHPQMR